jgi:hypothetical protein
MTRPDKHPRLTRGASIVLLLALCACAWLVAALVLMSSVQPTAHLPI